jgi:hypothetical protein
MFYNTMPIIEGRSYMGTIGIRLPIDVKEWGGLRSLEHLPW